MTPPPHGRSLGEGRNERAHFDFQVLRAGSTVGPPNNGGVIMQATRELTSKIYWFKERFCWRFPYRDPTTHERKFLFCTADKFAKAGIDLPFPDVVRKNTQSALGYCQRLQDVFLRGLNAIEPQPEPTPIAALAIADPPRTMPDAVPTLSAAIEAYFDLYSKSPSYEKGLRAIFGDFTKVVGDRPLDAIRDTDLKLYERHLAGRVGRTSVRSYLRQLGMLIHFGVRKGWIRLDPRLTYKLPKEELKEPDPFSKEELAKFFEIVRSPVSGQRKGWSHLEWIGTGLLHLGLRPIELMHAEWDDVNFEERFLYVRRSHPNKMPQACQNQPIPNVIWPMFEARGRVMRDGAIVTRTGLIWTGPGGVPANPDLLARGRATVQEKLPKFQWKRFRKTYATILERAGNDVVTVSRLLRQSAGGKNVTMAQRHYIGKSQKILRQVVDDALAGRGETGPVSATAMEKPDGTVDFGGR